MTGLDLKYRSDMHTCQGWLCHRIAASALTVHMDLFSVDKPVITFSPLKKEHINPKV